MVRAPTDRDHQEDPTATADTGTLRVVRHRSARWPALVAVALLVPLCAVYLWFPQDADGVLFEQGARRMAGGAVFYRDLWDIKQPGIYWVYQAGLALGIGVVGPRLLEIALALAGGWLVWALTARWRLHPAVRVLAPVLVIGPYLLGTHRGGVLAIEGLANPLLVLVFAAAWPAVPSGGPARGPWSWAAAGAGAGVVGVLKLVYLPLPATLLLGALVASRLSWRGRALRAVAAAAGAAVPLGATAAYFAVHGVLRLAWVTTIDVPVESVTTVRFDAGYTRWAELLIEIVPLLGTLALAGVLGARRRGTVVREVTLLAVVGEAIALAFQQYPTPYRMLVIIAPLALVAVAGVDTVWRRAAAAARPRVRVWALLLVAFLALPLARGPQRIVFAAAAVPSWGLGQDQRNPRDAVLVGQRPQDDVGPMRDLVRPGEAIYVFGVPQLYQELHAREAVEITGWASTLMPDRVWRERDRQLVRSRPRLVFVDGSIAEAVQAGSPRFVQVLATDYTVVAVTPNGRWFRTDRPGTPSGVPGDNELAS